MSEREFDRDRVAGDDFPSVDDPNRDPGADLDAEGVPETADESTPGKGEIPDPEEPIAPTEQPTVATAYGMGADEGPEPGGLDAVLAAEEPDLDERDVTEDRTGPAEEAALRIEEEEPPLEP